MKKILCIMFVLMFALGALAESAYSIVYTGSDYFVYETGKQANIYTQLKNNKKLSAPVTAQLIDQTDGTVLIERDFDASHGERTFSFVIPDNWEGLHMLAMYIDGEKCSEDFPVFVKEYERALKRIDTTENVMAVTIDCGSGGTTSAMRWLEVLEKYDARCTFFITGRWASEHPEAVIAIKEAGHEIGNHSWSHAHFDTLKHWREFRHEIMDTQDILEELTGERPTLFRVPYGDWSYSLRTVLQNEGFKELVQWNIESHDSFAGASASYILSSAMPSTVLPGSIVLFHNDDPIIDSLDQVLNYYTNTWGYKLVTVSELLGEGEYTIDDNFVAHMVDN